MERIKCREDERHPWTVKGTVREFLQASDPCLLDENKPKDEEDSKPSQ